MKQTAATVHKTRRGRMALGLMAFLLAYMLGIQAIDTARLAYYLLAFVLVVLGVRWVVMGFKR